MADRGGLQVSYRAHVTVPLQIGVFLKIILKNHVAAQSRVRDVVGHPRRTRRDAIFWKDDTMNDPALVTEIMALPLVEHQRDAPLPEALLQEGGAIIVFGHQLEGDGSLRPRLVRRLQAALTLARHRTADPLVLTGGTLGAPISEAEAMHRWLAAEGIEPERLHLEPMAEDTVGNAVHSMEILARLGVNRATLVSSTYHVRRGLVLLGAAAERRGLSIRFDHLASGDALSPVPGASDAELELILADHARLLAMPGL